ncbi:uncharacterized protein LOC135082714 [Ostrinia nubilalis]|uniref:uncharacterized protein LOC135082714 n=1 Tax=Ostrinia nubilalis TaxID=29057 RepID=UPI00308223E7
MSSKLCQLLVLLAAVASTLQRRLVSDEEANSLNDDGFQNLVNHLKTHAYPSQDKPYLGKARNDLASLLNVHTLNLFLKNNAEKKDQRTGVGQDRICKTGRCGCRGDRCEEREEDRQDDREDISEVQQILDELEQELDKDPLRCAERCDQYGRCGCRGRTRSENRDNDQSLCRHGRCGKRSKESNIQSQIEQFGTKYKINDDLDAIVVDISDFKGLLGTLNGNLMKSKQNQDRVDTDYFYGDTRSADEKEDKKDLDAVVLNLNRARDDDDVVSRVVNELLSGTKNKVKKNDPIRPNDLAEFFETRKRQVIGNALNFVRNSRGKKDLSDLSTKQQYQLQKVRAEVQRLGAKANLREVERKVTDIVLGDGMKSEVLFHNENNNNVYVPRWVYNAIEVSRQDLRSKRMFPLTNKQRLKRSKLNKSNVWRRNVQKNVNEYGVPFQLQVQGLGQVNP